MEITQYLSTLEYPLDPYKMNMGVESEYLPTKTKDNYAYYLLRKEDIIVKAGDATTNILENNPPYLKSEIELISDNITIELPRLYYLGYEIKLIDKEGNTNIIDYHENDNGFIEIKLNKSGTLEISYEGTSANKIANYITLITIGISISILLYKIYKKNTPRKKSNKITK